MNHFQLNFGWIDTEMSYAHPFLLKEHNDFRFYHPILKKVSCIPEKKGQATF